jgi:hypothetical protein
MDMSEMLKERQKTHGDFREVSAVAEGYGKEGTELGRHGIRRARDGGYDPP